MRELARARRAEKPERLSAVFARETGLPLDLVRHSAPDAIIELLASGRATQYARAVIAAELLLEDAAMSESLGKIREATIARMQARALFEHAIDKLSPEERAVYLPKLDALNNALTHAAPRW